MIKLTWAEGDYVYINPDRIDNITTASDGMTSVFTTKEEIVVKESPEEVVRKIMDYKLKMNRYSAFANAAASDESPHANDKWELACNIEINLFNGLKGADSK